jgi:hypothetical protein
MCRITCPPLAQIARFADIQHAFGVAAHEIYARPGWERAEKIVTEPLDNLLRMGMGRGWRKPDEV